MGTLAIALKDIVIDPEQPVDLAALPEEATSLIKEAYGFLGPLHRGHHPERDRHHHPPRRKGRARQRRPQALQPHPLLRRRGDYQRAIQQIYQVLAVLPGPKLDQDNWLTANLLPPARSNSWKQETWAEWTPTYVHGRCGWLSGCTTSVWPGQHRAVHRTA